MALVLNMRPGDRVYVDDDPIDLVEIHDEAQAVVRARDREYSVVDDRAVEVLPDVRLSIGDRAMPSSVRIAIQAPRDKLILREDKYLAMKNQG